MLVVVVAFRGVSELAIVRVDELFELDALTDEVLVVEDVLLDSADVLVDVCSVEEYEEELRDLDSDVLRVPAVLVDVPSARALRSFFILCAVTPARVASTGAAKMLTTDAQSMAKKQAPLEGLHPRMR